MKVSILFQSRKRNRKEKGTVNTKCLWGIGGKNVDKKSDQSSAYLFPQEEQILELQLLLEQFIIFSTSSF